MFLLNGLKKIFSYPFRKSNNDAENSTILTELVAVESSESQLVVDTVESIVESTVESTVENNVVKEINGIKLYEPDIISNEMIQQPIDQNLSSKEDPEFELMMALNGVSTDVVINIYNSKRVKNTSLANPNIKNQVVDSLSNRYERTSIMGLFKTDNVVRDGDCSLTPEELLDEFNKQQAYEEIEIYKQQPTGETLQEYNAAIDMVDEVVHNIFCPDGNRLLRD